MPWVSAMLHLRTNKSPTPCAGHTQQLQGAVRIIEATGPLAWWRVPLVVAGFAALVMAAAFLTHVEKRFPLVHYKARRFQARYTPALLEHHVRSVGNLIGATSAPQGHEWAAGSGMVIREQAGPDPAKCTVLRQPGPAVSGPPGGWACCGVDLGELPGRRRARAQPQGSRRARTCPSASRPPACSRC